MTEISEILAHRPPMLLVDSVRELVAGRHIHTVRKITRDEPWYHGADGAYPQVLLVESWAQSAGVLAGKPDAGATMLLGAATEVEFHRPVLPGDLLEHRVSVAAVLGDTMIFTGGSSVRGAPVLTVSRMAVSYRNLHKGW
ncbi:3-hydroxyacyl-ACP dehydratase FabZ family protein [Kutzneria buriramensis]|uniref:3-hydroxyacyl-[acyl-carrier-protein] dehydratase n=1 Tax=Kutzneria buriramensis TaxID=1045776 RepID=A0A3E0GU74_9PSEU|nr:hypothetical protein [Kutzneria buriramensis]REH26991.1 3-hydroxyacyl-[acyl-carrier-protein] dehydratase [Kutzneria buriramensis]